MAATHSAGVVMVSASSSGISMSKASSIAMISSTASRLSAPRSSVKLACVSGDGARVREGKQRVVQRESPPDIVSARAAHRRHDRVELDAKLLRDDALDLCEERVTHSACG